MIISKNKKVLIFSFAYYPQVGGAEVAVKEITDRLANFQFDMITFNFGGREKPEERVGNVNVFRVSAFTKYFFPPKSFFKGLLLQRKNRYDAVWAMMANTGFAALFLKLLFPKIKFVLTIQEGDPIPQIRRRVWFVYPIFRMIFRKADQVTAISAYLADFAKSMGARQTEVIPNGVDLEKFKFQKSKIKGADKFVLITTGRLVKKNAVDDIIRALKFLPENFILKSIGSGPDEKNLKMLARELDLEKRASFVSLVSQSELAGYLSDADIFVRPSLSEGLGNSFLEAMAVGLPIIGTAVGGIPDFLKDGRTGLFCRVRDPKDLAGKVRSLADDRALYLKLSQNGRKIVEENYDWDKIAARLGIIFSRNV